MYFPNEFDPTDSGDRLRFPPAQSAPFHRALVEKLNSHKAGLLEEFRDEPAGVLHFIRLSVNEAEGLAWSTPYAHLLLPALLEEKIQSFRRWASHQHRVSPGLHAGAGEHGGNTP